MKVETVSVMDTMGMSRGSILVISSGDRGARKREKVILAAIQDSNTWTLVPYTRKNRVKYWFIRWWDKILAKFR